MRAPKDEEGALPDGILGPWIPAGSDAVRHLDGGGVIGFAPDLTAGAGFQAAAGARSICQFLLDLNDPMAFIYLNMYLPCRSITFISEAHIVIYIYRIEAIAREPET